MKILRFLLLILILSMVLFLVSACGSPDGTSESEQAKETAGETSGETKYEISEEEMSEISSAILGGNLENLESLMTGFDINARDENGKTVLMRAVSSSHSNIIEYLIENGADVNACSQRPKQNSLLGFFARPDKESADDGRYHPDCCHQ